MPQLSLHTPLGELTVSEDDGAIVSLDWGRGRDQDATPLLREARTQLHDWFDGLRAGFDLPLAPHGTAFQRRVWDAMMLIPRGEVSTYGAMAARLNTSARAVGTACGANPIPILIPCHRVVASGSARGGLLPGGHALGGYSGDGGADTKRHLLRLEAALLRDILPP